MTSIPSGKGKTVFLALAMVAIVLGSLLLLQVTALIPTYLYNLQPGASIGLTQTPLALSMFSFAPDSLNVLYIQQVTGAAYGYITIGIGEGQGIITAKDLTTLESACASSPAVQGCSAPSLPAYAGDQVTFAAVPDNGYQFASMVGCPTSTPSPAGTPGCTSTTQNPVTVTISFSNQAAPGQGSAYAYFTSSGVTMTATGGAQGYINLAVAAGLGQLCATDLTSSSPLFGRQTCVPSGILYPFLVDAGDQVQFQAVPAPGYMFDYMQACGGGVANSGCVAPTTTNPVTAKIVQQTNGGYGGVFAYFSSTSSSSAFTSTAASTSTQTTPSPPPTTTTTPSNGNTVSVTFAVNNGGGELCYSSSISITSQQCTSSITTVMMQTGETVSVTALPASGYAFQKFTVDPQGSIFSNTPAQFTLQGSSTITVYFTSSTPPGGGKCPNTTLNCPSISTSTLWVIIVFLYAFAAGSVFLYSKRPSTVGV